MKITVYGKPDCVDYLRSKSVLNQAHIDYDFADIQASAEAAKTAEGISGTRRSPVVLLPDGSFLVEPSDDSLTERLREGGMLSA